MWFVLACAPQDLPEAPPALRGIPSSYEITDLGILSGQAQSRAKGLNNQGEVTGESRGETGNDPTLGFFWSETTGTIDLGMPSGYTSVVPSAIAFHGQVVGTVVDPNYDERAFVWEDGAFTLIEPLSGGDYSLGVDMNKRGDVVGQTGEHGFLLHEGSTIELAPLPGGDFVFVDALNQEGDIAGLSETSTGEIVAVTWTEHGTVLTDVGSSLPHPDFQPFDLAAGGEMVGWSPGQERAFLLEDGVLTDLGTVGEGKALGVNKRLEIVGGSNTASGAWHAFLWVDGTLVDLNDYIDASLGWELQEAVAINVHGQICGSGLIGGEEHAFLLTPQ
jgi:probable HAF family extracellular repeat protein